MSNELDWQAAADYLAKMKAAYSDLAKDNPLVMLPLGMILAIEQRYDSGERSKRLYRTIMALE